MYLDFFKLKEPPFRLTPDPNLLYMTQGHARVKACMDSCLLTRAGLAVVTGGAGTGKTTLIRQLLSELDADVILARIFQTQLDDVELLQAVLVEFGFKPFKARKIELLDMLNTFLITSFSQSQRPLLVIDDAHNLRRVALEEIRLLSGLETEKEKILQVILVGQPELDEILDSPEMEALKQRIYVRCHLTPLTLTETSAYIARRLEIAGAEDPGLFVPETVPVIYKYTGGIPRLINILCDTALTCAFSAETPFISCEVLREAIVELKWLPSKERRPAPAGKAALQAWGTDNI
jgi:type II secretory pathway predicted ATPase ExeA